MNKALNEKCPFTYASLAYIIAVFKDCFRVANLASV